MGYTRRDYRLYAVLYHMSRATGVLPVTWNTHINLSLHLCGSDKDCFSLSTWGGLVTIFHLVVIVHSAFSVLPTSLSANPAFGYLWVKRTVSAMVALLLMLLRQRKTLVECVSNACKIYTSTSRNAKCLPLLLFSVWMVYPFSTIFVVLPVTFYRRENTTLESLYRMFGHNYVYVPVAAVEVVISIFCFIAERAYNDINNRLRQHQEFQFKTTTFASFTNLLKNYIAVAKFVRGFAGYFSPHFLNSFMSFTLRMVAFTIMVVPVIKTKRYTSLFAILNHAVFHLFRISFVCYCCQKVMEEVAETVMILRRIRVLWVDKMSKEQAALLDSYEELMESTGVEFTACGLFPVNLQQVLSVIGLIITYGLVALQIKS